MHFLVLYSSTTYPVVGLLATTRTTSKSAWRQFVQGRYAYLPYGTQGYSGSMNPTINAIQNMQYPNNRQDKTANKPQD